MKKTIFYLAVLLIVTACGSPSGNSSEGGESKKASSASIVDRYSSELIANPVTQADKDKNLIINHVIDNKLDMKMTPSGIFYQIINEGTGPLATRSSQVEAHYIGTLLNGTEFDNSIKKGRPLQFQLGGVIKGWQESIQMLKPGGKGLFIIPSELSYGQRSFPPHIGPNSVLQFEIELLSVSE